MGTRPMSCILWSRSRRRSISGRTEMARHLEREVFPDLRIGLLHGRMKSAEKDSVMTAFAAGRSMHSLPRR